MSANNIYFPQIDRTYTVTKDNYIIIDNKKTGLPFKISISDFLTLIEFNLLTSDQLNAIQNSNNPNSNNPFITLEDTKLIGWTLDFRQGILIVNLVNPYAISINSITNNQSLPITVITVNALPYILGASIAVNSEIIVTVDIASVITLNIEKL